MDLKATYNKIASEWMRKHQGDTWWVEGVEKYLFLLEPNALILDVGCGTGEKSKFLVNKGFRVRGIDFSEKMIELTQKQVPQGNFSVMDIKQPLNLNHSFDGVFAQAILLHIPKNEVIDVLKNITLPLKSNGYFYIAVKELKAGSPDEEIVEESDYGYSYKRFFSYFTLDELKGYLTQIGLQIVYEHVANSGKTNWIQLIAKK